MWPGIVFLDVFLGIYESSKKSTFLCITFHIQITPWNTFNTENLVEKDRELYISRLGSRSHSRYYLEYTRFVYRTPLKTARDMSHLDTAPANVNFQLIFDNLNRLPHHPL